jgi:hypothetical protein
MSRQSPEYTPIKLGGVKYLMNATTKHVFERTTQGALGQSMGKLIENEGDPKIVPLNHGLNVIDFNKEKKERDMELDKETKERYTQTFILPFLQHHYKGLRRAIEEKDLEVKPEFINVPESEGKLSKKLSASGFKNPYRKLFDETHSLYFQNLEDEYERMMRKTKEGGGRKRKTRKRMSKRKSTRKLKK